MKKLLLTMGDPNGVGPEIIISLWPLLNEELKRSIVIVGSFDVLNKALNMFSNDSSISIIKVKSLVEAFKSTQIEIYEAGCPFELSDLNIGKICSKAGKASIHWVKEAVLDIQNGLADAMITAPLAKEAVEPTIPGFQGHTEYIGEMCGDPQPVLCLVHDKWVVAHVSTHVSLREACDRVTEERISKVTTQLNELLIKRGVENPRIGIAGLNPHAGENGLFGREEIDIIEPTIQKLRKLGLDVTGPLPADVVFPQLKAKTFDGVVAMYHDQGHAVTKTIAFELGEGKRQLRGVNTTLGLSVIRTSVDHGTGFDIAWKGISSAASLKDSVDLAWDLA
jgi:4-phospho-D-threonate 3-dehydrogenase / 4-phospho-D-erythronate 3-dehydrogenase